jgi:hypothetical protein
VIRPRTRWYVRAGAALAFLVFMLGVVWVRRGEPIGLFWAAGILLAVLAPKDPPPPSLPRFIRDSYAQHMTALGWAGIRGALRQAYAPAAPGATARLIALADEGTGAIALLREFAPPLPPIQRHGIGGCCTHCGALVLPSVLHAVTEQHALGCLWLKARAYLDTIDAAAAARTGPLAPGERQPVRPVTRRHVAGEHIPPES